VNDRPFVSVAEAARMLGVHRSTLHRWRARGVGPQFLGISCRAAYRRADLEAWHNDSNNDRPAPNGRPAKGNTE